MLNTAIIIAVGSKSHYSQLTYSRPRTMLPALGKPLVVRVMDRLHRAGIEKFIVILGEKEGVVATYLNERWLPKVELEFVLKLERTPLGQIFGDIIAKRPQAVLINGYNSFTHETFPRRMLESHRLNPDDLIFTGATRNLSKASGHYYAQTHDVASYPTGDPNEQVPAAPLTTIVTQPNNGQPGYVLPDVAVLGEKAIQFFQQNTSKIQKAQSLIPILKAYHDHGQPTRLAKTNWVLQVEQDRDLIVLNRYLLEEKFDANILSELPYTAHVTPPVRIDPGVSIGQGTTIGPHVYLEKGSSVGRNANIKNTLVLERANIPANASIENAVVYSRGQIQE